MNENQTSNSDTETIPKMLSNFKKTLIPLYKLYKPYKLSSYGKSNYFFSTEWSG